MVYEIEIAKKLEKRLSKLPKKDKEKKIDSLENNLRPKDCIVD